MKKAISLISILKITGLSDILASKKNNGNGEVHEYGVGDKNSDGDKTPQYS